MNSVATDLLPWMPWMPLQTASKDVFIPRLPGLYRLRRAGGSNLDYIGQTGVGLRQRVAMLHGIYEDTMPYRDPHTAGPGLWALRHRSSCEFEVSVVPIQGSVTWRKGLEALAIGLYRQEHRSSPTVQFGRMPAGYQPSSPNNAHLAKLGLLVRGGMAPDIELICHAPGVAPAGPLGELVQAKDWNGHVWSDWASVASLPKSSANDDGLYRIRGDCDHSLLYVGQGRLPARPLQHLAKMKRPEHLQGSIFAAQSRLEVSWIANAAWLPHQRLELVNDMIAAHVAFQNRVPTAQFLG